MTKTLFLDRDGVLNRRIPDSYVMSVGQFEILPGVLDAMAILAKHFDYIFLATNQQGVGKGLMSQAQLDEIHHHFVKQVQAAGGRVDKIYASTELSTARHRTRKPAIGMALQSRKEFPDLRFKDSIMVGDGRNDMIFGRRAGMTTVLVGDEPIIAKREPQLVDYYYPDLLAFAQSEVIQK